MFQCKKCYNTNIPHHGQGLCRNCYMKEYRRKQKSKPTYEEGIEEGRRQVVDALDNALQRHGGSCWLSNGKVYLETGGEPLEAELE